jgi:hypothetical protein
MRLLSTKSKKHDGDVLPVNVMHQYYLVVALSRLGSVRL